MRLLHRLEDFFLVSLVACLVILACGQILLRNFFGFALLGTDGLIRHLVLWIGMAGALAATRFDKHIRIDALLRLLPPRFGRLLLAASDLFTGALCALLASVAWRFVGDEREFGAQAFFDVPAWVAQLCFPLTFGLMALRFCYQSRQRLRSPTP